jgi:hypothetical protein
MNLVVACVLFGEILFVALFRFEKTVAEASTVNRSTCVLTVIANVTDVHDKTDMKDAIQKFDSGLEGTAHSKIMSGVPGGSSTGGPAIIEFAIAPIEKDAPAYNKALFVTSDRAGKYKISLSPGKYWIGPKAKASNSINYDPGPVSFSEKIVVVEPGTFTQVDLFEVRYAP